MSDATRKVSFKVSSWQMIAQPLGVLTVFLLVMALTIWAQKKTAGLQSGRPSVALEVPNVNGAQLAQDRTRSLNGNVADYPVAARPREKKFLATDIGPIPPLFLPPVLYGFNGSEPQSIAVGDVNGDRKSDLVVAIFCPSSSNPCQDPATVGVMLGNGDGTFQPAVRYGAGTQGAVSVVIADVNGDHKPDLIVADCGMVITTCVPIVNSTVAILLGNGDGTFQPATTYDSGSVDATSLAVADLNGDGNPDVVVAQICDNCMESVVSVLLGNGDGTLRPAVTYSSGGIVALSVAIRDVNGDGKPDLLVANGCSDPGCMTGVVAVLLGNGNGTFQSAVSYSSGGRSPVSVAAVDVNSDGKQDLLIAGDLECNPTCSSGIGVLLGNGDGTFQAATNYPTGGCCAFSMVVADLNGDGKPDVAVVHLQNANVAILLGNGDGMLQQSMLLSVGNGVENPGPLAVGDVDGNTMPDLVIAGSTNAGMDGAASVLLHVGTKPTVRTLTSSLNPSVFGQSVTFTATVSSSSGMPTGTVAFFDGSTVLETVTLVNGSGALIDLDLGAGAHPVTAVYQGSRKFKSNASSPLQQVVNKASTACSLASSLNPALVTRLVTYTATVTTQYGGAVHGAVTFHDGTANIATVGLGDGGQATYTTKYKTPGIHSIFATYLGDDNNSGSTSATLTETIVAGTKTTLTTSGSPSHVGQPVTFTATVTSIFGNIPDGELVTFFDGPTAIGTAFTTSGVVKLTTSSLMAKMHTVKAAYSGDALFKPSTGFVTQVVEKYPTTTGLTSSPNPSNLGQLVTFTAKVKGTGPSAPTGKVRFFDGIVGIGTVTLSGGVAKLTKANLAVRTHPITAKYLADADSAVSTSPVINQVVQ